MVSDTLPVQHEARQSTYRMSETPPAASSEPTTPSSNAADQARIRKERREAKIRAGGSARLNKITGLGGGLQRGMAAPSIDLTS
jgi:hypothetical protein